jgi:RNA 2',3'-cyclic 3'-phosphodiesterase
MKNKRLFLAIPIPQELAASINSEKEKLDLPVKWIPRENWHVTVHFYGNAEESALPQLKKTIKKTVQKFPPFTLHAQSILKKSGKGQTMIWVGFKEAPSFEKLALAISESAGVAASRKPLPHINLARHKERLQSEKLPLVFNPSIELDVSYVELWESKLSPKGSTYFSLESFTL